MNNIYLEKFIWNQENPFDKYPNLQDIWEPDLFIIAKEAIDESKERFLEGCDEGEVFLIKDDKKVIGITGYFPYEETYSHFFLRWHGILPEYQKLGISKKIIETIIQYLEKNYDNFSTIKEFMPIRESYKKTEEYFLKIGFKKIGEPEVVDWSKDLWQNFEYQLPQKKLRNHI